MKLPFAISVPHCSFHIPADIRPAVALTEREIIESTDIGTREVFTQLPLKAEIWAEWSRLVVDLNRDPLQRAVRGVIPDVDYYGRKVYRETLYPKGEEVEIRLRKYYRPYHDELRKQIEGPEIKALFDCHSLSRIGPPGAPDPLAQRKDIVLGNNGNHRGDVKTALENTTCPKEILRMMKEAFNKAGFSVSLNHPYPGGFITTHYGLDLVKKGKMAVQIEINQDLYLDPEGSEPLPDRLENVRARILRSFEEIARRL
jgi:N-formylglutamate amidohydrolase